MDSDDGSRKEEVEEDETPMELTSEKTEPNEGSHGELNVGGKPHVANNVDGKPPVATWKVLFEHNSDPIIWWSDNSKLITEYIGPTSTPTTLSLEFKGTF